MANSEETIMVYHIYTATGCTRCQITKGFMKENAIGYKEFDIKTNGQEAFSEFYRANRGMIYRGKDGGEFPVFTDGDAIRQGVGAVIAHLIAGDKLNGFIEQSSLHGEWIDGFNIAGGDPQNGENDRFKSIAPLPAGAMFKYRTAARRYMMMTEIEK
jgi:glutaredoxin